MLAYRHPFHAGTFADVFKHALLVQLVLGMHRKDAPCACIDTHAGTGRYDLRHEWALKNAEHEQGIVRVWSRNDAPPAMQPYLAQVRAENPGGELRYYPGSPLLMRRLLRPGDRLVLNELNRKDYDALASLFARDRQVKVHPGDAYEVLKAQLPPPERRGLVFVDSSFDRAREFQRLTQSFTAAYRKFATGVYALWYPLMEPAAMQGFARGLRATGIRKMLELEIAVHPENWTLGMRGCGMIVVNPPFGFERAAQEIVHWLGKALAQAPDARIGRGANRNARVDWLAPE